MACKRLRRWALAVAVGGLCAPVSVHAAVLTEYGQAGSGPQSIVAGPDGALWYTQLNTYSYNGAPEIGRITTAGVIGSFPNGEAVETDADGIAAGPDFQLWFVESGPGDVGSITTTGTITGRHDVGGLFIPGAIAAGPDGNLWVTASSSGFPRHFSVSKVTTAGSVTSYGSPSVDPLFAIGRGPDGNMWATGYRDLYKVAPATGVITPVALPTLPSGPLQGITGGPDGNVWFAQDYPAAIGRVTPAGTVTLFPISGNLLQPNAIAKGPDGNLWFTAASATASAIGRITPAGHITTFPLGSASDAATSITAGPDGAMWFAQHDSNQVGRITVEYAPTVVTGAASALTSGSATLAGTVNPRGAASTFAFQFGTTTAYGHQTAPQQAGAGLAAVPVSSSATGLAAGTTYHYRLIATDDVGTGYGADHTFKTAPPAPTPILSTIPNFWAPVAHQRTHVRQLEVHGVPSGGKVTVTCTGKGKGCPFKKKSYRGKSTVKLTKLFKHHNLRPGAVVTITITATNRIGKVLRFTMRKHGKLPSAQPLCLAPGSTHPKRCS